MLRKLTRYVFGANALYQGAVGLLALLAPSFTIWLYGGSEIDQSSPYLHALFRMIGALLVFVASISALIAKDPDGSPILLIFMALLQALGLFCWGLALAAGDVAFSQVWLDVVMQIPVLLAALAYYPRARQRTVDTLELLMSPRWREEMASSRLVREPMHEHAHEETRA
jgi:hypothetical protein